MKVPYAEIRTWSMLFPAVLVLAAGCQTLPSIEVVAEPDANSSSGTSIEVIYLLDDVAATRMPTSARAWFADETFRASMGADAIVQTITIPTNVNRTLVHPATWQRVTQIWLMVNYAGESEVQPVRLSLERDARVILHREDVTIETLP